MSSIDIKNPAPAGTTINATNRKVPRRQNATTFEDSNIEDSSNQTTIYPSTNGNGLANTYPSEIVKIGQCLSLGTNTYIELNNVNGTIEMNGNNLIAGASGAPSGNFLNILVNGVPYKIDLLNP